MDLSELYRAAAKVTEAERVMTKAMMKFEKGTPYKAGDIIDITTGYAYKGKKCLVRGCKIKYFKFANNFEWAVFGKVLKADGTPGRNTVGFTLPMEDK